MTKARRYSKPSERPPRYDAPDGWMGWKDATKALGLKRSTFFKRLTDGSLPIKQIYAPGNGLWYNKEDVMRIARKTSKLSNALLKRAEYIAAESADVQNRLTDAFTQRYGVTYSDVDADEIIDILDYGGGRVFTVDEIDAIMTKLGHPPKEQADA